MDRNTDQVSGVATNPSGTVTAQGGALRAAPGTACPCCAHECPLYPVQGTSSGIPLRPVSGGARPTVSESAWRPCLAPETDLGTTATSGRWWVLHARARHEKRIAELLAEHAVCHYLPLVNLHRTYVKAKFTYRVPLFPGYVFLYGDHGACEAARRTNRIANLIFVDNQAQLRAELRHLYQVVESGHAIELFPALQVGQRCRITSGVLKGVEGTVLRRGARCRMFLAVSTLGQSAMVEVDAAVLETVD